MLMEKKAKYAQFGLKGLNKRFKLAALSGDLNQIRYFLLVEKLDIHYQNDFVFRMACKKGYLEVIKYLLTSEELTEHSDIHANNELGLRKACEFGHLEIIQYLTISPELTEHANVDCVDNLLIKTVKYKKYQEVENFLLYFQLNKKLPPKLSNNLLSLHTFKI